MVILFSGRKCPVEREIIDILTQYGGDCISDKVVNGKNGGFIIVSQYKKTELNIKKGIAVFIDDTERFAGQHFPSGITGICEDTNIKALELFRDSNVPVISCGMNSRNTMTLSSINSNTLLVSLQRTVTDSRGNNIDPGEFKIRLTREYNSFSVMAATAVLLLRGIIPDSF